jgi:hypothetical protein
MAPVARLVDRHLLNTIAKFPDEIRNDPTNRAFYLSIAILQHFFGSEWADEYVQDNGRSGYVRMNWRDQTQAEIQSYRVVDLAEVLFNLQHIEGFDDCIQKMRDGDIEGTYAELDLGRMLYLDCVPFRFVARSGQKGDDYDIEITMNDGVVVCADAKCKIEATTFSENGVMNSLRHARTQFPASRPSIVFVKVPPHWLIARENAKFVLTAVANKFLSGTGRVVSVKYYVSHIHWENGEVSHTQSFQEINNIYPINRFDRSRNWDMFKESTTRFSPNAKGEFSDVPERWRHLTYYPNGIPK